MNVVIFFTGNNSCAFHSYLIDIGIFELVIQVKIIEIVDGVILLRPFETYVYPATRK